ncbi:L-galactose dehydrogenase, Oxidoreductase, aldo/keto reductase family protein [Thermobacillus xylanilyticus]|jgi:aryl-alcohol dehydrogenase-like predicted oxidoreductase|uniref:L-galactose dehydrogenase, Oxidoreductase, aldo/keto reductase family protein n=2 Tax=Thermobacillus TaxID=76632 RepID=A0ABM8V4S0_THEXY|nr:MULTISPECIES: aldo/keto reductase [Thermobacillus]AGA59270.1 putative oxidoreductase, aryl-alcohol dehydrogenase like protein [Thermobacillus composti KWC4]REJ15951.1 MAG: aldo/keto reductase [Paenibacillaceae bacterium]CAG5086142.1 L-galactose dehydrogenase, Oxidoreductase, aldo/keto reductase family protein [Thermobacillus xylanilyticus]
MRYRKLGNTGLDVSVLSFGASSLGSVFREADESESIRTVHAAIDAGINYIDVSPYYGLTRAETVLGKAIRDIPRDKFLLSTKAGRYGVDAFDFSARRIQSSLEESLTRLHTDYVDLFFLHDIEFVPADIVLEEAVPAAMRLKEQGKIRFWGISGLPLQLFEKMLPQIDADVILSYCHYSLNDTALLDLLPMLEARGIGLVNASPLSMGLLSLRGTPDWHPASPELKAACRKAAEFCAARGTDIAKLAIQFSTGNERIPTTLVSTANPDNIARNARWTLEPIDEELLREVLELLAPVHNVTWVSGRPEYNENIRV